MGSINLHSYQRSPLTVVRDPQNLCRTTRTSYPLVRWTSIISSHQNCNNNMLKNFNNLCNRLSPFSQNKTRVCNHEWLACILEESFNCKMRMPGTVKCRPIEAYWVQIDGINIATELITRYYLNGTLIQCCFNARPLSATLAQHWTTLNKCTMFERKSSCPANTRHLYNIYTTPAQRLRRWFNIA